MRKHFPSSTVVARMRNAGHWAGRIRAVVRRSPDPIDVGRQSRLIA
jgi:hypothetical protein